jgi:hypothetical protein
MMSVEVIGCFIFEAVVNNFPRYLLCELGNCTTSGNIFGLQITAFYLPVVSDHSVHYGRCKITMFSFPTMQHWDWFLNAAARLGSLSLRSLH